MLENKIKYGNKTLAHINRSVQWLENMLGRT